MMFLSKKEFYLVKLSKIAALSLLSASLAATTPANNSALTGGFKVLASAL